MNNMMNIQTMLIIYMGCLSAADCLMVDDLLPPFPRRPRLRRFFRLLFCCCREALLESNTPSSARGRDKPSSLLSNI
eukprot:m.97804 g.97804  ORF g.97804 m.97804 type:complete len:77 (+) comp14844_c0_seq3:173-403(+)